MSSSAVEAVTPSARAAARTAARAAEQAARVRPPPPVLTFREKLGDGIWLILLAAIMLPGLYVLSFESERDSTPGAVHPFACYSLFWFVALFVALLATLLVLHLVIWMFPRPVSHVDKSPLSAFIAAVIVGGPPMFAIWSASILLWPAHAREQCAYEQHKGLWTYFGAIVAAGIVGAASLMLGVAKMLWQTLVAKQVVAPSSVPSSSGTVGATPASTFTGDMALDNGRWLTMESRRIRGQMAPGAAPRVQ